MKRRSFLAWLSLSPIAPIAVKAEETKPAFFKTQWYDYDGTEWVPRSFEPSQLQKLRVADARRRTDGAPLLSPAEFNNLARAQMAHFPWSTKSKA